MTTIAISLIIGIAGLYACVVALAFVFQRSLLYFPQKTAAEPGNVGLPSAEVRRLQTEDGETIVAWFLRRPGPNLLIYFHGFGFSVLALDYRGYGASTGVPSEAGLHLDAAATYAEALKLGFAADRIVLLGESLGSGPALKLATQRPVAGITLDSPYSSVLDVASGQYWFLPVRLLLRDRFRSANDWIIPIRYGRRLAALGGPAVTFFEVPKGNHVVSGDTAVNAPISRWLKGIGL
jgi:pimeloyl-ACP methyl ester carboxylesterase